MAALREQVGIVPFEDLFAGCFHSSICISTHYESPFELYFQDADPLYNLSLSVDGCNSNKCIGGFQSS